MEVTIEGDVQQSGMVIDFGDLSRILKEIIDEGLHSGADKAVPWDHSIILSLDDPLLKAVAPHTGRVIILPCEPTAENMAGMFASMLQGALDNEGKHHCRVRTVKLWETEKSYATWDIYDEVGR
jgi:6-pyruvoyl-tetrahydropterin synthase